jgi:ASC-1-like (ASCH) protein
MFYDHLLKTWPEYFQAVKDGLKTFEIRVNDREFKVGDVVKLVEYDNETDTLTGDSLYVKITYITDFGQPEHQVVFGFKFYGQ